LLCIFEPRRQQVTVHRPEQPLRVLIVGEDLDGQDVLSGFRLSLAELLQVLKAALRGRANGPAG